MSMESQIAVNQKMSASIFPEFRSHFLMITMATGWEIAVLQLISVQALRDYKQIFSMIQITTRSTIAVSLTIVLKLQGYRKISHLTTTSMAYLKVVPLTTAQQ